MRPRRLRLTQRSDIDPPIITPKNDEKAMVMVESGPACDMGICQVAGRIGLLHANIPNMIGQITSILAAEGINIANMTNKSRDKYAYTLLDLENPVKEEAVAHLEKISGLYKVRVIKG